MIKTPIVSINLCCYNSEKYLEETLQSILAQTYSDWELVVVNDGSTDSTEQIVKRHMREGRQIVYHFQRNMGLGKARNKAIELSGGEFIALIDHDDKWEPEKLEKQLALFAGRPQVALTYTDAEVLHMNGERCPYPLRAWMCRGRVLGELLLSDFIVCSTIMFRRSVLDEVGWFDADFTQVEEYDLMIRVAEKYEFDYVDKPLAVFRIHERNSSWDRSRMDREVVTLIRRTFQRMPQAVEEFGPRLVRLRLAGVTCTPGQACLVRRGWRGAHRRHKTFRQTLRVLPSASVLYLLSFLPIDVVANLIRLRRKLKNRLA